MLNYRNRVVLLSILFLVALFILHFTANMFRNLNHDEHVYIASAIYWLQHGDLPYRDFPHLHLPNLMFIYSFFYMVTDYHLLTARAFSTFCGWLLLVVIYMLPFQTLGYNANCRMYYSTPLFISHLCLYQWTSLES